MHRSSFSKCFFRLVERKHPKNTIKCFFYRILSICVNRFRLQYIFLKAVFSKKKNFPTRNHKSYSVTVVTSVPWDMGTSTASISMLYGKKNNSSSTEAYFNHAVITARWLVCVVLKNEPMYGGGERANVYTARHSPPKWEGHLAI